MKKIKKKIRRKWLLIPLIGLILLGGIAIFAAVTSLSPMSKPYLHWEYGESGDILNGVIPALGTTEPQERPWELSQWTGIVNYPDDKQTEIPNYDVFNIKRQPDDPKFDKENGFGLVFKSPNALATLFEAFTKGNNNGVPEPQWIYYKKAFMDTANDPAFKYGHLYYYRLEYTLDFLRTAGIIQRMGFKFDQTKKIDEDERQAIFTASPWPTLSLVQTSEGFKLNYKAYGYSNRNIRIIATKRGAFPNIENNVVSLTGDKYIQADSEVATGPIEVKNVNELREKFGNELDVVMDDGYGRTVIKAINLSELLQMDYVPDQIDLTKDDLLKVDFHYTGHEFDTKDYVSDKGIPMTAQVTITGPVTTKQTLQGMYIDSPDHIEDGQAFTYMFGVIDLPEDAPAGSYTIKAVVTINDPNHQDRALEYPIEAYKNNTIEKEWPRQYMDLIAEQVRVSPSDINEGDNSDITATVTNDGPLTASDVLIRFTDNGKMVHEEFKTLPSGETTVVGPFTWTGQGEGNHNIMVDVDPNQETDDIDFTNNTAIGKCFVKGKIGPDGNPTECNNSHMDKSWEVTYPTITGYKKNNKGKKRPIWSYIDRTYSERLDISSSINTKQGISTQPNDRTDAGRESRGSWEIIPWSQKNGKNPNEVTRAGYGVEFKVITKYLTDWETKIPHGYENTAKPIGGKYYGPDEVFVWIWDTKGKYVGKIQLEKTGGTDSEATWELPATKFETSSGPHDSFMERKFYTDKSVPDGEYTFTFVSQYAGKHRLSTCTTQKMTIFGSMYDDSQSVRDTSKY